ncbi:MAG: hypothetical protein MK110_09845 [Fuerstiella sp.]|nr:hypothetical protein [Fuerstiella sp.]
MMTRTVTVSIQMTIAVLTCLSCTGAEELRKDRTKPTDPNIAEISFRSTSRPCADIIVTLPEQYAPSFRVLLPEDVSGCPHPGYFHVNPVEWKREEHGSWSGMIKFKDYGRILISLVPRDYYVEVIWTLENLSPRPLQRTVLNFCFNVNNGGGGWANREFLPKSRLDRIEDGEYWHNQLANKGTFVHRAGNWRNEPEGTLDASILVIANEVRDRYAFQMWDKPVEDPWINNGNACMHLRAVLCESLGVGEQAVIRGRIGISSRGLDEIWLLHQSLTQTSKEAAAKDRAQSER